MIFLLVSLCLGGNANCTPYGRFPVPFASIDDCAAFVVSVREDKEKPRALSYRFTCGEKT
jgi:hypothetical protein